MSAHWTEGLLWALAERINAKMHEVAAEPGTATKGAHEAPRSPSNVIPFQPRPMER